MAGDADEPVADYLGVFVAPTMQDNINRGNARVATSGFRILTARLAVVVCVSVLPEASSFL